MAVREASGSGLVGHLGSTLIRRTDSFLLASASCVYPSEVNTPPVIPSGTVTLFFTDIEGSTRLWEADAVAMAAALRRHDVILRSAINRANGFVFKTVGDAFHGAFETPLAAVSAALDAQRVLSDEAWPTSNPVRVRMGIHTGVAEERDNDYFGPTVNRTARLEAIAHGGQVLVSGVTAELVADTLPRGAGLRNLGMHRLKDLGRPEQVYQLEADGLDADFPPLSSLDNPELPNNLPTLLSPFIGRDRELAEVRDLLRTSRLVTLTGAGGSGKTRLALQAAAEALGIVRDGVWLVDLAPLTEPEQIPVAVATVLGIPNEGGPELADEVVEALSSQDTLLILDNCEHLIDAAARFCDGAIRLGPKVRFLATSREPLGIDGERVYRVPSMSLPPAEVTSAAALAASDAVELFTERAQLADPAFVVDDASAPLVASICRRLDGIPLALELAAARLTSMSLQQVSQRLDQRFRLLTGGSRNAMPRQQTLQATVDWSFALLNQNEQQTLLRLSVFAGGFQLEGAEAVASTETVDAWDVADLVGSLVDKSLVIADHTADSVRYRLLDTIRQYAAEELLREAGDAQVLAIRDRHAAFYLNLAQAAEPALKGYKQGQWQRRLDAEWDNLRAVFAHLAADERDSDVLKLGAALLRFAISRGHADVLSYLRHAVDGASPEPDLDLASALYGTSELILVFRRKVPGEVAAAGQYAERAAQMARELADQHIEAEALGALASARFPDDPEAGRAIAAQAVAIARQLGDVQLLGELLSMTAAGCPAEERHRARLEALACARQAGDDLVATQELSGLYGVELHAGRIEQARGYLDQAIEVAKRLKADFVLHLLNTDLGLVLLIAGKPEQAESVIRKCLLTARRIGTGVDASELLTGAACSATWQGDYVKAARLHGAADVDRKTALRVGAINWSQAEQNLQEKDQARLRELLGDQDFDDAYRAGARLSASEAIELALGRAAA
jgi:predicted ATPase/class 3 adenylate cyclase